MADTATPPANAATAAPGTATNEPDATQTFTVSKDDWDKTQKTLNSLAAMVRKQTSAAPPATPAVTTNADDDEPKTQKETVAKMMAEAKAEREELRKERESAKKDKQTAGILTAITKHEVDPEAHDLLLGHLEREYGSKITVEGTKVLVTDELGESKEIGDVIGEFLKSPKGKFFKPVKAPGPNTRAGRGNSAPIPGQKSFMDMSIDERLELQKKNPAAYMQAVAAASRA